MRNTWHFNLPESLLLPTTNQWAEQQGFSTMLTTNIQGILLLFETFSAFSDLPLGLNSKNRQLLRDELQKLKQNPNSSISDVNIFIKKMKEIKEDYHRRKQLALQKQLPIFVIYSSDDLTFIAVRVLKSIENYLGNAKNEINRRQYSQNKDHIFHIFSQFIKETEPLLRQHQETIAQCMLLRLQEVDTYHSIQHLSPRNFTIFHHYIKKHGNAETQKALKELSWLKNNVVSLKSIIKPKEPQWPRWLFRGSDILHRAFGDSYHQSSIAIQIRSLQSINFEDVKELERIRNIQINLTQEINRLKNLKSKLFPLFHSDEHEKINRHLKQLNITVQHANQLIQSINKRMQTIQEEHQKNQEKQNSKLNSIKQYDSETAILYFLELINGQNNIVIDGVKFKTDDATQQRMKSYLSNTRKIQHALLQQIQSSNIYQFSKIHNLVEFLGEENTRAIWKNYIDQYRFNSFMKLILDGKNSEALLKEFMSILHQVPLPFPSTETVHTQLIHLVKYVPTDDWTEHQHKAIELLNSYRILSEYYKRAMNYYPLADLIIERFSQEQSIEIEFPELKDDLEKLIQRWLVDKEAQNSATMIQAEIENGEVSSALSRLNRLQLNLHRGDAKRQLVVISHALTETHFNSNPNPNSHPNPNSNLPPNPQSLSQRLYARLQNIFQQKGQNNNFLSELLEIQQLAEQLPYSQEYLKIKRLCAAGDKISITINGLTNAILSFAMGEILTIPLINPLLLDIIEADLITIEKKKTLLELINATLMDSENTLPSAEKRRLLAVKKCLDKTANDHDRAAFIEDTHLNLSCLSLQLNRSKITEKTETTETLETSETTQTSVHQSTKGHFYEARL